MKHYTTRLTISLGCVLLATSGCAAVQATSETFLCVAGSAVFNAVYCPVALVDTMALIGNATRGIEAADPDSTTDTPSTVVLRWDETYAPLPTTDKTPEQPESPIIPSPLPTPHNNPSKDDTKTP